MVRKVLASSVSIVIMILLVAGLALAGEKPVIEILEQVEITAKTILLGDVARLSGFGEQEAKIKNIELGSAALPGSSVRYSVGQIQVRLRQAGFNPFDFNMVGASQVVVFSAKNIANTNNIASPDLNNDGLESDSRNNNNNLVNLQTYEVVVPTVNITRHEIITEDVLTVEVREGYSVPRDLASLDDLIGKRATRLLVAGTVLYVHAGEVPPVLERNARVAIVAEGNGLKISTLGITQQAGGIGDFIPVRNISSGEIVFAEVISSEIVKVELGGSTK